MLIGITGKIGSGKSTLAQYLVDQHGYEEYSFADPLKQIAMVLGFTEQQVYGTQENKLEIHPYWGISGREFLQKAGTELFRQELPRLIPSMKNIWIELFRLRYEENPKLYVVSDVRFLDEAKIIKELGGIVIRTKRTNLAVSDSKTELKHSSETEMERINVDYTIDNDFYTIQDAQTCICNILDYEYTVKRNIFKI